MKKKIKNSSKVQKLALPMFSAFDVNGSYTGNPTNGTVITGGCYFVEALDNTASIAVAPRRITTAICYSQIASPYEYGLSLPLLIGNAKGRSNTCRITMTQN